MKQGLKIITDKNGKRLAEVIRSDQDSLRKYFFFLKKSAFQFGFVFHKKGYEENAHYHKKIEKKNL